MTIIANRLADALEWVLDSAQDDVSVDACREAVAALLAHGRKVNPRDYWQCDGHFLKKLPIRNPGKATHKRCSRPETNH